MARSSQQLKLNYIFMMKKNITFSVIGILGVSLLGFAGNSDTQSLKDIAAQTRAEMKANPLKAAGVYYNYPVTIDSMAAAPAGYKPFYLSHYGRHGSRWIISQKIQPRILRNLRAQERIGNLTEQGKEALKISERLEKLTRGHWGELTKLGERQHFGIARRMVNRFPDLFKGNAEIKARSSVEPRCIVSMAAFSEQLMRMNPEMHVDRYASPGDMEFIIKQTDEWAKLNAKDNPWRKRYAYAGDSLMRSEETAVKFFKDISKVPNLPAMMKDLYDIAIDEQDMEAGNHLLRFFTPEDLYNQWKVQNYLMYVVNGNSLDGTQAGPRNAVNLVREFIATADEAIAGKRKNAVDLRFGHDTALLPMLALMNFEEACRAVKGHEAGCDAWQNFRICPMGANVQFAFLRNDKGDVIVAPRLNEMPARISGIKEVAPGYYKWKDVRDLWNNAADRAAALTAAALNNQGDAVVAGTSLSKDSILTFNADVREIAPYQFVNRKDIRGVRFAPGSKLEKIGEYAFLGCENMRAISLPSGLKSLGEGCFRECGLTSLNIPSGVKALPKAMCMWDTLLREVKLPSHLEDIGSFAFTYCEDLRDIIIPQTVRHIGSNVFGRCRSLESITLPKNMKELESYAFAECVNLRKAVLPANANLLGELMFSGCRNLKDLTVMSTTPPPFDCNSFIFEPDETDLYRQVRLHVPKTAQSSYRNAPGWNLFYK